MKKFGKFLLGALSLTAAAGGAYCLYKNRINKENEDDFDDEMDAEEDLTVSAEPENREYVSITITTEDSAKPETDSENSETSASSESSEVSETSASSNDSEDSSDL